MDSPSPPLIASKSRHKSSSPLLEGRARRSQHNLIDVYASYDPVADKVSPVYKDEVEKEKKISEVEVESEDEGNRFHRITARIGTQYNWTKENQFSRNVRTPSAEKERDNLIAFNRSNFKICHSPQNYLTPKVRHALQKQPWSRTDDEVRGIVKLMNQLTSFSKYASSVKYELAKIIHYEAYEDGRVILQEGQFGVSFYYVVTGSVLLEVNFIDKTTGETNQQIVNEKKPGESFGETVLMQNTKRIETVFCKRDSEFLRIDKADYDKVLTMSYIRELNRRIQFLLSLELFSKWAQHDLKLLNSSCRVIEIAARVVIKDLRQPSDSVYFIMSGKCQVVRQIPVIVEKLPFGKERLSLAQVDENDEVKSNIKLDRRFERIQVLYLVIQTLKEGDYFGADEKIGKSSIMSVDKVELLSTPKSSLICHKRGKFLESISRYVMAKYPTRTQAFQSYLTTRNWKLYKQSLVKQIVRERGPRISAKLTDVPMYVTVC